MNMNIATCLDLTPSRSFLGAGPQDISGTSWDAYFRALRNSTVDAWNRARDGYHYLVEASAKAGVALPLTNEQHQQFVDAQQLVTVASKAIDDALAGERKVGTDASGDVAIESLPDDDVRIALTGDGRPILVNPQGQQVHASGTVGIVWLIVLAGTVVTVAQVYVIKSALDALQQISHDKVIKVALDLAKQGKGAEAQAILDGATNLEKARGETKAAEGTSIESTVKTALWAGVAIALLYVVFKSLPSLVGSRATNPQLGPAGSGRLGNPRHSNPHATKFKVGDWVVAGTPQSIDEMTDPRNLAVVTKVTPDEVKTWRGADYTVGFLDGHYEDGDEFNLKEAFPIANPGDYDSYGHYGREGPLFLMWFGQMGTTHLYVWADSFDSALEVAVEWLDDHAPGHLVKVGEDELKEAAEDEGIEWKEGWPDWEDPEFEKVVQAAEADLTMAGGHTTLKHGDYLQSDEWGGNDVRDAKQIEAVKKRSKMEEGIEDEEE